MFFAFSGLRGVRILQQSSPFRKSVVEINISKKNITLITTNVVRLQLSEARLSPVNWGKTLVIVDNVQFPVDGKRGKMMRLSLKM